MVGEGVRQAARTAGDELRERTLYFAEVEHKVKTALSVLQGWAVTLDERWDVMSTDARREGIAIVRRAADMLVVQAEGMLEEARAELHSMELAPDVVELGDKLHEAAKNHRSPKHAIVVDASEPVRVHADPVALQQVIAHLVENALKYSPDGGSITLRGRVATGFGLLEVQDEGIGLRSEDVDSIFEPFRRGGGEGRSRPGVGLGLYIVRKLVVAMGAP